MHALAFLLIAHLAAAPGSPGRPVPLELTNNKPFVPVTVNGSTPQWFILDTGCSGTSIVARETAERLKLALGAEARADVGAGSGADVRISQAKQPVTLVALGETLTVVEPRLLTLGHVARYEGRRVDGLLGGDFMFRHVVTLDYADRTIAVGDTTASVPPPGALVVPLDLDTGWPVAAGTITPRGGKPIPCRMIVDTGVRGVVTLFAPFSAAHGLVDAPGSLPDLVVGGGAGGLTRGDVVRLEALTM